MPLRQRSGDLGARHRLPRARGRQPLRRRHELLPEHRRGEPGADGDGQRAARRRPPARAPRGARDATGGDPCRLSSTSSSSAAASRASAAPAGWPGSDGVRVTLIDRNNYHQFQPLLYQVATSQLASSDVAFSLRKLFHDDAERRRQAGRRRVGRPGDAHGDDRPTASASPATPGPGRRLAAELLPHARARRSTRSRSTRSTTRSGCARASSASSRTPTATRRCSTRAR